MAPRYSRRFATGPFINSVTRDTGGGGGGKFRLIFERDAAQNTLLISENERDDGGGGGVNLDRKKGLSRVTEFMVVLTIGLSMRAAKARISLDVLDTSTQCDSYGVLNQSQIVEVRNYQV